VIVPTPDADHTPYNNPVSRRLGPGQQLTVTFAPQSRITEFYLPMLGISKYPNSSYEVWMDDEREYGPSPVPPTDVDDMGPVWIPAKQFRSELRVIVRNLSDSTSRTYTVQPIGWEVPDDGA